MNGPTYELQFIKGTSYKIPRGYSFQGDILNGGYIYTEAIYIGLINKKPKKSYDSGNGYHLLFKSEKDGFFLCKPRCSFHKDVFSVYLEVIANKETVEACFDKLLETEKFSIDFWDETKEFLSQENQNKYTEKDQPE